MITVTVCVGSSCHIKGAYNLIRRLNELLNKNNLEGKVEIKGSLCMERCGEGINWQIDHYPIKSTNIEDADRTFKLRVIESIKGMMCK